MEACRVFQSEIVKGKFSSLINRNKMRSTRPTRHVFLGDEPTIQPPDVASPVYLPPTVDGNVIAELYPDEVLVIYPIGVVRPMLDAVAGSDFPPDLNHNVIAIVDGKW